MKTLNHFFFSRGAVRVLALALIAQLAFAIAGSTRAQAQCAITTASGQFGAGNALTWELCNDGTLTISGTGEMTDLQYKMP
ncbi:MAG: hypothetical protein LBL07_09275, partial [Tannerella sp.]|nr:hypothetical protein [Tannerella sp.]